MIKVDFTSPDLLESDRQELVELVAQTNYKLEVGNVAPLLLTVETYQSDAYRASRDAEREGFAEQIGSARELGEEDIVIALEATARSRAARAEIVDRMAFQLWDLLT